jgi:F420-dependent methylenetetrahydromethanopterin dehydrogenase
MIKFTFCKYEEKNIVLLTRQWATAWIVREITKTGLLKSVDHYVFEQDIEKVIEPIMNIKDNELEKLMIYHEEFVNHYINLRKNYAESKN